MAKRKSNFTEGKQNIITLFGLLINYDCIAFITFLFFTNPVITSPVSKYTFAFSPKTNAIVCDYAPIILLSIGISKTTR